MTFRIGTTNLHELKTCELQFQAVNQNSRLALAIVRDHLARRGLSDMLDRVELVVAEVLNNIAEHAYAGRRLGDVDLHVSAGRDGADFTIVDTGKPLPSGALPAGVHPDVDNVAMEDLPEGGFGWALIHQLTQELKYNRERDRNCLQFRITAEE